MREMGDLKDLPLRKKSEVALAQFHDPEILRSPTGCCKNAWEHRNLPVGAAPRFQRLVHHNGRHEREVSTLDKFWGTLDRNARRAQCRAHITRWHRHQAGRRLGTIPADASSAFGAQHRADPSGDAELPEIPPSTDEFGAGIAPATFW